MCGKCESSPTEEFFNEMNLKIQAALKSKTRTQKELKEEPKPSADSPYFIGGCI